MLHKKIAILGYGLEGKSTIDFLLQQGFSKITILDERENLELLEQHQNLKKITGTSIWKELDNFDVIFRSPGISPFKLSEKQQEKINSQINYFLENSPTKNIIGVTGTKGKGTTSSLIAAILNNAGLTTHLAGNIGVPVLDIFNEVKQDDFVVLELSSFQTFDLKKSPHIAVILMTTQEHLDYHKDQSEYWTAKAALVKNQTEEDFCVVHADFPGSQWIATHTKATQIHFSPESQTTEFYIKDEQLFHNATPLLSVQKFGLIGKHNWNNILAACNAVACLKNIKITDEVIIKTVREFTGLELRIERIAEKNGITFINDSFSTTPETAIAAINSFPNKNIAILLGGSDKGSDYAELAKVIGNNKQVTAICYGQMGAKIAQIIKQESRKTLEETDLENAFQKAIETLKIQDGGICLLSPACASFDQFSSYKERGKIFNKLVENFK